jgi:long-chain fatty acid transport protein
MKTLTRKVTALAVGAALSGFASNAVSGGLGIGTQSGSGTGNAFAGGAASVEDASTVWYNPAGMAVLPGKTNFAIAAHMLKPSFKFQNTASTLPPAGGEGGDGGGWHVIPQGYVTHKLTNQWSIGAAFNTPFGLETEYDRGWRGQAIALESALKTYNLNLAAAYRFNDMFSVGAGVNYQRAELKFNSILPVIGFVEPDLSDDGTGFNLGVLFQPNQQTRVGAHYRSSINYNATGMLIAPAAIGGNSAASAGFTTPDSFSFSAFHALSPRWEIMGDITWTGWEHVKQLSVVRTSGPLAGTSQVGITFNWDDTMRYSAGANYRYNDSWKFRFGVAYDETPTNDVDRTARLPDQDRKWVAVGAQWKLSKSGMLDFAYAHEFIKDASVRNTAAVTAQTLIGQFNVKADIFSVQYSHSF